MWFKKKPKETHVYGGDPVCLTGRYYTSPSSGKKICEILRNEKYNYWVPLDALSEIKYEL